MRKVKARKEKTTKDNNSSDDSSDEEDSDSPDVDDEEQLSYERDETGKLTGVGIYAGPECTHYVRRYSLVMVQAAPDEYKFLGYVRDIKEIPDDVELDICWFYRFSDIKPACPADFVICRAKWTGQQKGSPVVGDKGKLKEIFFSNHTDTISIQSVMHPIKVWLLPSMSLDPVTLPALKQLAGGVADLDDAKAEMKSAPWHGPALLPGYICRRMYDIHTKEIYLFSDVMSRRQPLEDWIITDLVELLRRSKMERAEFTAEWLQRRHQRALKALQQEAPGGAQE